MKALSFFLLLASMIIASAQPNPATLWTRTFGGPGSSKAFDVQLTSDGGYILAGYTDEFGAGLFDMYVIKIDSLGDTLWTRTYGGREFENAQAIQETTDDGFIIVGQTNSYGVGLDDFFLVKIDSGGDTLWTRVFGTSYDDRAYAVQQTIDGGYIIAGSTRTSTSSNSDILVLKTDSLGNYIWSSIYGGNASENVNSVFQISNDEFIIGGNTYSYGLGYSEFYLLMIDSYGDTLWTRTYGTEYYEEAFSTQPTLDGGYIMVGNFEYPEEVRGIYIVKTNSFGDTMWTRIIEDSISTYTRAKAIYQTTDGGYIIAGEIIGPFYGYFYVIKTNEIGQIQWSRSYPYEEYTRAYSIKQTSDNGYIIAGKAGHDFFPNKDVYIIKTGTDLLLHTQESFTTLLTDCYILQAPYPNPFNASTTIPYTLSRRTHVKISIHNLLGREVASLEDHLKYPGLYNVTWNADRVSSGIFFCRMQAGNNIQVRKLLHLK